MRAWWLLVASVAATGCVPEKSRGFHETRPWLAFYGTSAELGDVARAAATFRILDIDADPDQGNFNPDEIATLRAGGRNRVLSYLNVGSCEQTRRYFTVSPAGYLACGANLAAQLGAYVGFPGEVWMNPANIDYQNLIVEYVAPRLVGQGVDGLFLDNLEIVEHGTATTNGPCDAACAQGGLDLVARLRAAFPQILLVMQNATSDATRLGRTAKGPFPTLLDGVTHEAVYYPSPDATVLAELSAWGALALRPGGAGFLIGTEDYVGDCASSAAAQAVYAASRAAGFSPYVSDASTGQRVACYWPF